MILAATSATQGSEIADTVIKAAIGVGVAQLVAGAVLLLGWYFVQKRFVDHEFPGVIQRMTGQITSLEATMKAEFMSLRQDISSVRADISSQGRQLERHDERLGHQGRRIDRLETRSDNDYDRRRSMSHGGGSGMSDLDDTRTK